MTGCLNISVHRIGSPMECEAHRIGHTPEVAASRIGKPIKVTCSLVCTTDDTFFLRVSPDVIWLLPEDFSTDVFVDSNVKWTIE